MKAMNMIAAAVRSVIPDMLSRTWKELDYRLDVFRATNGAKIEKYQSQKNSRIYPFTIIYGHVSIKCNLLLHEK